MSPKALPYHQPLLARCELSIPFRAEERPESFDKDFARSWVAARCDPCPRRDSTDPGFADPGHLCKVYIEAFETITGQSFTLPDPAEDLLACVRRNLAGM